MVDFNLIQEIGTEDGTVEDMLKEALGEIDKADYMDEVLGDEIAKFKSGEILTGKIVGVNKDFVIIDVGLKSEGQIPKIEFEETATDLTLGGLWETCS